MLFHSLDTFASKTAAIEDESADNSVGNVTGSNAVNVFLGIGIAWTMAAIFHESGAGPHTVDWKGPNTAHKFIVPVGRLVSPLSSLLLPNSFA